MKISRIEAVHQSLKRCDQNPDFLKIFYEKFFATSPEVREKFVGTDMQRQTRMVTASLYLSLLAADDVPYALDAIHKMGKRHHGLGVEPQHFDLWLESLMATIAECDDEFDEAVDAAWRDVLNDSIERMLDAYPG